ncbi:MAG: rhomboid family intramembrane serine protease [Bacteroidota bacterium]
MNINTIIIIITIAISVLAFRDRSLFDRFKFNAYAIKHQNQWYRAFSYGLIHADLPHLAINMFVLYSFGNFVLDFFQLLFEGKYILYFLMLYIGGLGFSTLFDMRKYNETPSYNAVGASGAVSAVLFTSILIYPLGKISLLFIPIGIPSFIFGGLYLAYSAYMGKKNMDNIGHSAHFWGAIYGLILPIALKPSLFGNFLDQIMEFFS